MARYSPLKELMHLPPSPSLSLPLPLPLPPSPSPSPSLSLSLPLPPSPSLSLLLFASQHEAAKTTFPEELAELEMSEREAQRKREDLDSTRRLQETYKVLWMVVCGMYRVTTDM